MSKSQNSTCGNGSPAADVDRPIDFVAARRRRVYENAQREKWRIELDQAKDLACGITKPRPGALKIDDLFGGQRQASADGRG